MMDKYEKPVVLLEGTLEIQAGSPLGDVDDEDLDEGIY